MEGLYMALDFIKDAVDATKAYPIQVSPWASRRCQPRNPEMCAGSLSAKHQDKNIKDIHIFRGVTYIQFKDKAFPLRYQNDYKLQEVAKANDLSGMKGVAFILRLFKTYGEPFTVWCLPPRKAIQLQTLRSPEHVRKRNESSERTRKKPKSKRRKYTSPKIAGLRSGQGLAHSWEARPTK
jgi:hypothetical protein